MPTIEEQVTIMKDALDKISACASGSCCISCETTAKTALFNAFPPEKTVTVTKSQVKKALHTNAAWEDSETGLEQLFKELGFE